jgi:NAD(P)-dependent dehydrogenase (short-subunit alcohol dehydrogenase family)
MGILDGKVAIVTGAGRGIGRGEAMLLAAEGAKVVVNDLGADVTGAGGDKSPAQKSVDDIIANGGEAIINADDISSWQGAKNVIDEAISTWGKLDIVVNNAGILRDKMSFNIDESDWDDVIRVHLKGHFAMARHAASYWRERSKAGDEVKAAIVNTSSESGIYGNPGQANYSAAKAGIASLTWVMARELQRYGVRVNAIAPRARTRMTENLFGSFSDPGEGKFDAYDPLNVAPMVAFLASDLASDISGQIFVVYGGEITVMQGFTPAGELKKDTRWTPSELAEHKAELFADHPSVLPGMPGF